MGRGLRPSVSSASHSKPQSRLFGRAQDFQRIHHPTRKGGEQGPRARAKGDPGSRSGCGVNQMIAEAVGMKFLAAPLTPEQVKELIQILQQDPRRLARIELLVLSRG